MMRTGRQSSNFKGLLAVLCLVQAIALTVVPAVAGPPSAKSKVLVIGFDGMDPVLLEEFRSSGAMPNFDKFLAEGGQLSELATSVPPQSPVAWSNFITGRDSGGHGIYDFIHRDPETLLPYSSTSEAKGSTRFIKLGSWKIPRGGGHIRNLREGTAFWEILSEAGIDATVFKVPSNFPPIECEARSLSGMGTPDLSGNYGISTLITDDPPMDRDLGGGRVESVWLDDGVFSAVLIGPRNTWREGDPEAKTTVTGRLDPETHNAWIEVGDTEIVLEEGEWSEWITLEFPMVPLLKNVSGICRFFLIEAGPALRLYVTPIQIDPMNPEMPISTPSVYSREIAEVIGPYYTQGLPEDTSALENGFLNDSQYVELSNLVLRERLTQLDYELDRFSGLDEGFLFFYFNAPDQTCHMHWRNMDPDSPTHASADPRQAGRIAEMYVALDAALGDAMDKVGDDAVIMIMSDHGFAPWNRAFHVNTWLLENGYLFLKEGMDRENVEMLIGVDWSRTRAYALGINGLYLNLQGREKDGIVQPGAEQEALLAELKSKLEATVDPLSEEPAIKYAYRSDHTYHGPLKNAGPDIVMGYHRGWRGSNESALGSIPAEVFTDNLLKWSGDHCIAADEVPGILMTNKPILRADPGLVDMAPTILRLFGITPLPEMVGGSVFEPR
ncbi:MAG: alkaline phosphatase family protein [Gemmatimonadales bacterium]|nr:alkaline phosphatase family protein [Gemmatimonadales bacterium]